MYHSITLLSLEAMRFPIYNCLNFLMTGISVVHKQDRQSTRPNMESCCCRTPHLRIENSSCRALQSFREVGKDDIKDGLVRIHLGAHEQTHQADQTRPNVPGRSLWLKMPKSVQYFTRPDLPTRYTGSDTLLMTMRVSMNCILTQPMFCVKCCHTNFVM